MQSIQLNFAGHIFEVVCNGKGLREVVSAIFKSNLAASSHSETGTKPFSIELFQAPSNEKRLFESPLLPLNPTKIHLRRERDLNGWVLGDLLHIGDGESFLDLDYQKGIARGFFSPTILQTPKLLTHSYLLLAIVELLRSRDVYFMHGGLAVSPRRSGVLFLGDGGSGKSTCVYNLLRQGWSYVADDTLLMQLDSDHWVRTQPLLSRFLLHGTLVHHFPGLVLEELQADGKGVVNENSPGIKNRVPEAVLDRIIVLKRPLIPKEVSRLQPLGRSALLAELIRQNPFLFMHEHLASRHLEFLARLCMQANAAQLEVGTDLITHPDRLSSILARLDRAYAREHYF